MEKEYPNITFIKVNVDENSEVVEDENVSAMPTFKFYQNGEENQKLQVVGASVAKIESSVKKLYSV